MPRAIEHADRRSLPYLEKLTKKHGCGRRSRHDCYHCLRGDNVIDDAIQHARTTAAPSIEASLTSGPAPSASAER
jgi:hypothetical protein